MVRAVSIRNGARREARLRTIRDWTWNACKCGHFMIDHKGTLNYQTGRITVGACHSSDCDCTNYNHDTTQ